MALLLSLLVLGFFSVLAFWQTNSVLFFLSAAISILLGLAWYDTYATPLGMGIALALVGFGIACLVFGFRCLFLRDPGEEVEDE